MKASVYINNNDYYCVSLERNDSTQDILETNYKRIADDLSELINNFKANYDKLEELLGNFGSVYLSDIVNAYFQRVLIICQHLQPRECYVHLFVNHEEESCVNSYDSTTPSNYNDAKYVQLVSLIIADLVRSSEVFDELDPQNIENSKKTIHPFNTLFDKRYPVKKGFKA